MYGYIYLTTNLVNGKKYIGQHKCETFDTNYYGSGKLLLASIAKYGVENFTCELIEAFDSKEALNKAEYEYIEAADAVNSEDFYNLKSGGEGSSVRGCIYIRNINTNQCKKVLPEELDYYLSNGYVRGGPIPSDETKTRRALGNTGKRRSAQTKQNIANSLKGKKLSPEHALKLRLAALGKPSYNKGMIQIHKHDDYIFIAPEELNIYEQQGWVKGGKSKDYVNGKKGKIAVNKDNKNYFISPEELHSYLNNGYSKGALKTGPVTKCRGHWYTDGNTNLFVKSSCVAPDGFKPGRIIYDDQRKKMSEAQKGRIPWNKK